MIRCIIIVAYRSGGVLFEKYYGEEFSSAEQRAMWLVSMRNATAPEWTLLLSEGPEQVALVDETTVVYKLLNDCVVMVSGTAEHDALLLLEFVRVLDECLRRACGIGKSTRSSAEMRLVQHYADICLVLDEMVDDGEIDHLDPKMILKMIKLQPSR
mmetsp:Transcript_15415/g.31235  ORF Transcript_15415/g.31235 Transcript_15415/m.31235 type:complete len:156 (-) Transcript_15415:244-711(-)